MITIDYNHRTGECLTEDGFQCFPIWQPETVWLYHGGDYGAHTDKHWVRFNFTEDKEPHPAEGWTTYELDLYEDSFPFQEPDFFSVIMDTLALEQVETERRELADLNRND